jgi:hypothetical protein
LGDVSDVAGVTRMPGEFEEFVKALASVADEWFVESDFVLSWRFADDEYLTGRLHRWRFIRNNHNGNPGLNTTNITGNGASP